MPQLGEAYGFQADLVPEERHRERSDRRADARVDGREGAAHDRERRLARHAASVDEPDLEPGPLELGRDLRPGAMNDADLVPLRQRERERRGFSRDGAADLEHDPAHVL